MNTKYLIIVVVLLVLVGAGYLLKGEQEKTEQPAVANATFEARVLALNDGDVAAWTMGDKKENISTVKEGDRVFFPIVVKNYTTDEKGTGEVSATLYMKKADGAELWRFEYPNLVDGVVATTTSEFVMMAQGADGDDFTPAETYPAGKYTIHADVTDKKSGKTVVSEIVVEKVAE